MSRFAQEQSLEDGQHVPAKIIPVMREAITMVQMIFFKQLQQSITSRYPDWDPAKHTSLAGAAVNNLFGTVPLDPAIIEFAEENRVLVEEELRGVATELADLCPYLTDALRMKTLCDNQEGVHSIPSLLMAKALGILLEERSLPMPSTFMLAVRTLSAENGLVEPFKAAPPEDIQE